MASPRLRLAARSFAVACRVPNSSSRPKLATSASRRRPNPWDASLSALQVSYVDLLMIHGAMYQEAKGNLQSSLHASTRAKTWKALVAARASGKARSIGVCNFSPRHLAKLSPPPAVLQLEYTPFLQRPATLRYCREKGIAVQAYGSGGGGWQLWKKDASLDLMHAAPLQAAAAAHGVSAHQVSLRWALELGACVIPKAAKAEHQVQNRDLFGFALTDAETAAIAALDAQKSVYKFGDPDLIA